nr:DUF6420 family protein [Streptomyces kasugaensis]
MTTEHRGAAGPYTEYNGLTVLHATETGLPLLHPNGPVPDGRCVTPGRAAYCLAQRPSPPGHAQPPRLPRAAHRGEGRGLPAARPGHGGALSAGRMSTRSVR